jgi:6-phosphogluconate dehydrogenase (decarboxylating)
MGANIVRKLMRHGHECLVFNRSPEKVKQLASEGATGGLGSAAVLVALAMGAAKIIARSRQFRYCSIGY